MQHFEWIIHSWFNMVYKECFSWQNIVNSAFIIAFLVHFCYIGYYVVNPEYPTITVLRKDLKDIDFPLGFRLCFNEPYNGSLRFQNVGYKAFSYLFSGESRYKRFVFGWKGHFENGSTFQSVEGTIISIL